MFFSCANNAIRRKSEGVFFCLKIYSYWIFLATLKINYGFKLDIDSPPPLFPPAHVLFFLSLALILSDWA